MGVEGLFVSKFCIVFEIAHFFEDMLLYIMLKLFVANTTL